MISSYSRGHLCEYLDNKWIYFEDKVPIGEEVRPCRRCGKMPTPEGYDACLGHISGITSACCGHGVGEGFAL